MDPHKSMCNIYFFTEMISVCDIDFFTGMISVYHCIVSILNVYLALGLKRVTGKIF